MFLVPFDGVSMPSTKGTCLQNGRGIRQPPRCHVGNCCDTSLCKAQHFAFRIETAINRGGVFKIAKRLSQTGARTKNKEGAVGWEFVGLFRRESKFLFRRIGTGSHYTTPCWWYTELFWHKRGSRDTTSPPSTFRTSRQDIEQSLRRDIWSTSEYVMTNVLWDYCMSHQVSWTVLA